jgi:hypothetical protein
MSPLSDSESAGRDRCASKREQLGAEGSSGMRAQRQVYRSGFKIADSGRGVIDDLTSYMYM